LGTYMPYSLEKRPSGGFESRPCKDYKDEWVINLFCLMSILCVLVLFFFFHILMMSTATLMRVMMPVYIHMMCPILYFCFPYVHTR
jgi:hypothetical protein